MRPIPALPIALLAACLSLGAAQAPVPRPPDAPIPDSSRTRTQQVSVTVRGCLNGNRLEPTPDGLSDMHLALLKATDIALEGPRDLMRQLTRDHKGHEESISGIAIIPPQLSGSTVDVKTAKKGKTTISGGVRDSGDTSRPAAPDMPLPVRIKVQSATHLADRCVPRR